jgi:hypothetical protein
MIFAPGLAHLHAIKLSTPGPFYGFGTVLCRDAAPVPFPGFIYWDHLSFIYQNCTATRVMLNQVCTWTAKSALPSHYARRDTAYPPCTGTIFWLKNQDSCRMLRRVTLTKPYRRAVMVHSSYRFDIQLNTQDNDSTNLTVSRF